MTFEDLLPHLPKKVVESYHDASKMLDDAQAALDASRFVADSDEHRRLAFELFDAEEQLAARRGQLINAAIAAAVGQVVTDHPALVLANALARAAAPGQAAREKLTHALDAITPASGLGIPQPRRANLDSRSRFLASTFGSAMGYSGG